jgi:demethylmenaquinone methyltransferase / 2-methoxy-6-polyprenyl-1,4-benzoquinol methylase
VIPNRVKFFFAGPVLELANPRLPGRPHERLVKLVPNDPGRVLEICAGTGYLSRMVARAHPEAELCALDISPEMLAVGRRRAATASVRIAFVAGDASELPFADDHFDVVLAAYGLHELPNDVRVRAVREAARVLRPGGRLLAVDIDAPTRPSRMFSLYMRWIEKPHAREVVGPGLSDVLECTGFDIGQRLTEQAKPVPFQLIEAVAQPA